MSKFLKLVAIFLFPIFISMLILEVILRNIPNDYAFKQNILENKSDSLEVLFMGNSHAYFGINPIYSNRITFNGAHISQSLDYDFLIINKYNNKLKNLKVLVVPVDYFSLFSNLQSGVEKWRQKNYTIYYKVKGDADFWTNFEIFNGQLLYNLSRAFSFLFYNKNNITCNPLGFGITFKSNESKDLLETGVSSAIRHTILLKDSAVLEKNLEAVNSLINYCNSNNLKLIFVTYPCYFTYSENLNDSQLNRTISTMNSLTLLNKNVHYYNLLTDSSFQATDFYDGDHLNEVGAKKLTLKMNNIIDSVLIHN